MFASSGMQIVDHCTGRKKFEVGGEQLHLFTIPATKQPYRRAGVPTDRPQPLLHDRLPSQPMAQQSCCLLERETFAVAQHQSILLEGFDRQAALALGTA